LVELGERYARATGCPIQYQWTLLAGVNDGDEELNGIIRLLTGKYAMMNFIPYNANEGLGFSRPSWEHAAAMAARLQQAGIVTRLRNSVGQSIDGGCGQLRARVQDPLVTSQK
jgi:23S rRNA (adenine2503-C2)-methyltransferase